MNSFSRQALYKTYGLCAVAAGLGCGAPAVMAQGAARAVPPGEMRRDAVQVLNRLAYGPRPGDIEAVAQQGARRWIEAQLYPERIDNSAIEARLAKLQMLGMTGPKLMLAYTSENAFKKIRKAANAADGDAKATPVVKPRKLEMAEEAREEGFLPGMGAQAIGEMATAKLVRAVESPRQLQEVLVDFWSNHFNLDVNKGPVRTLRVADERDAIRPFVLGKFRALLGASAHSPAMLVYLDNAKSTREFGAQGGRRQRMQALRNQPAAVPIVVAPVGAAPANAMPVGAMMTDDGAALPDPMPPKRGGVNENYARELMELHTLGVDGGYTQQDVQEVARCFTGWSIDKDGQFLFRANAHDDGEKTVLGQKIPTGGGQRDGEMVLDMLASSPATARHIAGQLAMRLVSDTPPPALVERAAQVFLKTGGDLREVTRSLVLAPEFFDAANQRVKIKSPFEFTVSAVRAMDGQVFVPNPAVPRERVQLMRAGTASLARSNRNGSASGLAHAIGLMGQPLFGYSAPTGYSENSQTWVSTGGLVSRLNFALDLASGGITDAETDRAKLLDRVDLNDANAIIDRLNEHILGGAMTASTRRTLETQAGATPDATKLLALTLGSPEFQRR